MHVAQCHGYLLSSTRMGRMSAQVESDSPSCILHYDMRSMMRLLHWVGLCKATKLNASLSNVTVLKSIFAGALRGCCSSIGRYMEDEEDQESFARSLSSLGSL